MDYTFYRDIVGQVRAKFSMGHEVIGHWLNEEISSNLTLITSIEMAAKQLEKTENEWQLVGHEYRLTMTQQDVIIQANQLDFSQDEKVEDFQYYDEESIAVCGLTDFLLMLQQYQRFITEQR